ncbi:hypothetical protein [Rivularia sp. UHCC 0363]|uniref:hypothetical protein n=1 Tax=Rivularia sp. UHCC 0363 TaxID=3110244 RepID=UPI002B2202C0|nr:hypothetical protein [Rivularia sp. UHCC 0363]MEA5593280.1 hypothetical protein [Rivularia sp. UHCC 0363]
MKLIQYQANVLWDNVTSIDTIQTYKQALTKTWNLLKETAMLLLMLFLLVVVFVVWVWHIGFSVGWKFRRWMESPNQGPEKLVLITIKSLSNSFAKAFIWVKDLVEKKLGLELPASNFKLLNPDSREEKIGSEKESS